MILRRRSNGPGRGVRLASQMMVVGLVAAVVTVVAPGVAHAGAIVACPGDIQYWYKVGQTRPWPIWEGHRYRIVSATPRFLASDGRAVSNGLPYAISATVTATQQQTFTVQTTVGVAADLTTEFRINVSVQITQSRSTAIGVSTTFEVPPYSTIYADYGVHGFEVSYYVEKWRRIGNATNCEEWGYYPSTATAPTNIEGWQIRTG